jgi:hypothetical protein
MRFNEMRWEVEVEVLRESMVGVGVPVFECPVGVSREGNEFGHREQHRRTRQRERTEVQRTISHLFVAFSALGRRTT